MKHFQDLIQETSADTNIQEGLIGKAAVLGFAAQHRSNRQLGIKEVNATIVAATKAKQSEDLPQKIDALADALIALGKAVKINMDLSGSNISTSVAATLTAENVGKLLQQFNKGK